MRQLKIEQSITRRESASLTNYFQELNTLDLVTPEQEAELARSIREGDERALNKLVKANLRFVVSVAKQYQHMGVSLNDLINEGNIGLIKAAKKFDETRGFKFISYAVWWIRQSIHNAIQQKSRIVRIPANKSGLLLKIKKAQDKFLQENEREPDATELAEMLELSNDNIEETLMAGQRNYSLDEPVFEDEPVTRLDLMSASSETRVDKKIESDAMGEEVATLLRVLKPREQQVVRSFFGIGCEEKTLGQISRELNVSKEMIRQLKARALKKLRNVAGRDYATYLN